jgi:hypothetical protein
MKKRLLFTTFILSFAAFSIQSCRKDHDDVKYVTLNETVHSGDTYSLNLSSFGDSDDIASISQQAKNYGVSQLDTDPVTNQSIYHFSLATKLQDTENVQLTVAEGQHNGRGDCGHGHKTIISINLTVTQ